jgi:hypothetical protein
LNGVAKNSHQPNKQDAIMIQQSELTAQDIRETMESVSQAHLPLKAKGYICTSDMLYDVLMKGASEDISIDEVDSSCQG